jgi:tetratricopeptide (TPR) repeat protein
MIQPQSSITGTAHIRSFGTPYTPPTPPDPETLPDPGPLPPGSRLPFHRNDHFTGRVESLKVLARILLFPLQAQTRGICVAQATQKMATIQGIGGVGKTQLAIEFAYRYGRYFHGVHWLDANLPDTLGAEVAACGEMMDPPGWPEKQPDQITRTLNEWQQDGPRLMILDGIEDVSAAWDWSVRLSSGPIRLLFTTRCPNWPIDLGPEPVQLDVFTPEESFDFLRRYLPIQALQASNKLMTAEPYATDVGLATLTERLGHLPLTLELAGRYLRRTPDLGIATYLEKLEDVWNHPSVQGWRENLRSLAGHDLNPMVTFALSWEGVKNEATRRLFLLSGHCAPNRPIPRDLIEQTIELEAEICDDALLALTDLGLLMEDVEGRPTIHPLLAEYARVVAKGDGKGASDLLPALTNALATLTQQVLEADPSARFAPLRPHVEVVAAAAQEAGLERAGTLWNNLGYHLHGVGDYTGARAAYERALVIDEVIYGPDHPKVGIRVNNLGLVLHDLGDLRGARAAFERALVIGEAVYGPDHPKVATRVNNLGLALKALGNLVEARSAFERALSILKTYLPPDHQHIRWVQKNLGRLE